MQTLAFWTSRLRKCQKGAPWWLARRPSDPWTGRSSIHGWTRCESTSEYHGKPIYVDQVSLLSVRNQFTLWCWQSMTEYLAHQTALHTSWP